MRWRLPCDDSVAVCPDRRVARVSASRRTRYLSSPTLGYRVSRRMSHKPRALENLQRASVCPGVAGRPQSRTVVLKPRGSWPRVGQSGRWQRRPRAHVGRSRRSLGVALEKNQQRRHSTTAVCDSLRAKQQSVRRSEERCWQALGAVRSRPPTRHSRVSLGGSSCARQRPAASQRPAARPPPKEQEALGRGRRRSLDCMSADVRLDPPGRSANHSARTGAAGAPQRNVPCGDPLTHIGSWHAPASCQCGELRTARADLGDHGKGVTAASLDRAWGRRTCAGNRDRWLRGAVRSARVRCRRSGTARTRRRARTATPWHRRARCRPRPPTREQTSPGWPPTGRLPFGAVLGDRLTKKLILVLRGTPATVDEELDPVVRGIGRSLAQGTEEIGVEVGYTRNLVIEDRRAVGDGTVGLAERTAVLTARLTVLTARRRRCGDAAVEDEDASNW